VLTRVDMPPSQALIFQQQRKSSPHEEGRWGFILTPLKGVLGSVPTLRGISTFTKFIYTFFSTPLRGEKQGMNF
jgi:hypothetical protein